MFSLDSLISVAKSNILSSVSLHSIPPISGLEIMVHLISSWMNGIISHLVFRPKLNALFYVCRDQVSHIKQQIVE
jgi:hypothetical protein